MLRPSPLPPSIPNRDDLRAAEAVALAFALARTADGERDRHAAHRVAADMLGMALELGDYGLYDDYENDYDDGE